MSKNVTKTGNDKKPLGILRVDSKYSPKNILVGKFREQMVQILLIPSFVLCQKTLQFEQNL